MSKPMRREPKMQAECRRDINRELNDKVSKIDQKNKENASKWGMQVKTLCLNNAQQLLESFKGSRTSYSNARLMRAKNKKKNTNRVEMQ